MKAEEDGGIAPSHCPCDFPSRWGLRAPRPQAPRTAPAALHWPRLGQGAPCGKGVGLPIPTAPPPPYSQEPLAQTCFGVKV